MNLLDIEKNVRKLIDNIQCNKEQFIFELLRCYGIPKASITKLQKGNLNISLNNKEILWKNKVFFKECNSKEIYEVYAKTVEDEFILKNNPMFIIVTDYKKIIALELETKETIDIEINQLVENYTFFCAWAGMKKAILQIDNPADVKAAEKMIKMYDEIKKDNKFITSIEIHELNVFLARLLFCFFAEDTGIFEEKIFTKSIISYTQQDGSDLGEFLQDVFNVLNQKNREGYPEYLKKFPYVGGGLFEGEGIKLSFNFKSRQAIIENGELNWADINPDIFGSMIQSVVNSEERSNLGMHYTSVPNIVKVINPLFMDDLNEEFERCKHDVNKLKKLITRLSKIKIFDPACGSGNFLIIAYKKLRELEMRIINQINKLDMQVYLKESSISLSQFCGIEIKDFAQQIARLSLWLIEKQMDFIFYSEFGYTNPTLPLKECGNVVCGNSNSIDWDSVCPITENSEVYVLGNPPYLGAKLQKAEQRKELEKIFDGIKNSKTLDYIACWFYKGAKFIQSHNAKCAFVSTNSICQGEQVGVLWKNIFELGIEINFAYTSFKWENNARDNAGVTCIIVGLANKSKNKDKKIFFDTHVRNVNNINPYLIEGKNIIISSRKSSISNLPPINLGNMPNDGGNLILSNEEKDEMILSNQLSERYLRQLISAKSIINNEKRWCIWLEDKDVEWENIEVINHRIEAVKRYRLNSSREATRKLAKQPQLFGEIRQPKIDYIAIPRHSSEKRKYIPINFYEKDAIIHDSCLAVYSNEPWVFGVLISTMHMVWIKVVGGKLETRLRYSVDICYNTFPLPKIGENKKNIISECVFKILEEREKYSDKTLAELYDPNTMPKELKQAHDELDIVVERCYKSGSFESDGERLECLFNLYEQMLCEENKNE